MTFIQPHRNNNFITTALVVLVVLVLGGTLWTIMAYAKTVDLAHDIAKAKAELDVVGAKDTAMSNQLIAMLGSDRLSTFTAKGALVEEKKPTYVPIAAIDRTSWPIASQ